MNPAELLAINLNGRLYGNEIMGFEEEFAEANKLLVVFGYSDDCIEFRGVIYDECGCWDGKTFHFHRSPGGRATLISSQKRDNIRSLLEKYDITLSFFYVKAEWCPLDLECSWRFTTDAESYYTFDIMCDGGLYCRGLVIDLSNY